MLSKLSKLEQAQRAWNSRLYEDLMKPAYRKRNKQACKARKQARYRQEQLASLHASARVNRPFVAKTIRRRPASASLLDCTREQAREKSMPSSLD